MSEKAFILRLFPDAGYPQPGRDYYVFADKAALWAWVDDNHITAYEASVAEMPVAGSKAHERYRRNAQDSAVSGYNGPEPPYPSPAGPVCPVCQSDPCQHPCVPSTHVLEAHSAAQAEREAFEDAVERGEFVAGWERLMVPRW